MQQVLAEDPEHDSSSEVSAQVSWGPAKVKGRNTARAAPAILEIEGMV
jgi:hypothetical protein